MLGTWNRADNNSVQSHRKLVDGINQNGTVSATGDLYTQSSPFGVGVLDKRRPWTDEYQDAQIVLHGPNSEPDFGDERYWCQLAETDVIVTDQTDAVTTTLTIQVGLGGATTGPTTPNPVIVPVTNRLEGFIDKTPGLHTLRPGQWVRVRPNFDGDGQQRWVMDEPEQIQYGLITCLGPCGEPDFTNERYWVSFARPMNRDGDPVCASLDFEPELIYPPPAGCGGSTKHATDTTKNLYPKIVCATNLNEFDCKTHNVRPGTPIILKHGYDLSNPPQVKWVFEVADQSPCFSPCYTSYPCCLCYQITTSADPDVPPIQMHQTGPKVWANADGTSSIRPNGGGGWLLTISGTTTYTSPASPCPSINVDDWKLTNGNTALLTVSCCEPSSSSSSSSSSAACCDCYTVSFQGHTIVLQGDGSGSSWTNESDDSYIQGDGQGNWTLTLTINNATGTFKGVGPCPPTGSGGWGGSGSDFPTVTCDCGSSSSSSSKSSKSSSSASSSAASGSASEACTPICGIRYNTSTKCFEFTTDGSTWTAVENACASPCGDTGSGG